ncbi:hypothetical protein ROLI_008880 [Roseobacter fucihabitans]|uniref:Uncharacterized protein n=1 Tax=Roseobacter fucihabitans TaxID=1537242 RepID=A0ABZ2BR49_9RHOB|nr:hypothetical protein [Roseobacter litoralis]MBC6968346.1 hypothetical protein [Roseobacter litoralis]
MNAYSTNRNWSDRFLPEIKRLVGGHLLETAPDPFDHFQATDLMMLDARDMRVAARVRRPGFAQRFPHQFTIRSRVASGAQTELSKIVEGKGDWMFYGHSDAAQTRVETWWLIDLKAFRAALIRSGGRGYNLVSGEQANPDGTHFAWFDMRSFPSDPPLVVAQSRTAS